MTPALARTAFALALLSACTMEEAEDKAREAGEKAKVAGEKAREAGKELADKAGDKTRELAHDAGDKTRELAHKAEDKAKDWWAGEVPDTGDLSERAAAMLRAGADKSGDSAEALVAKGFQVAPVAVEIAKTLHSAVDSDTVIEPIVQKVDDKAAQKELDEKIKGMPRVETIEGVSVGFKEMQQMDTSGRTTESAYLVLWRRDDRLLGFVYRSRKRIEVEMLIAEAPRIIGLVQGVL